MEIGSAPFSRQRTEDRSSAARSSGLTRRLTRARPKLGAPVIVARVLLSVSSHRPGRRENKPGRHQGLRDPHEHRRQMQAKAHIVMQWHPADSDVGRRNRKMPGYRGQIGDDIRVGDDSAARITSAAGTETARTAFS